MSAEPERPRVLVVDDSPTIVSVLENALSTAYEVETALTAEEGLAKASPFRFAVVVVDKNLPGISGLEMIAQLRKTDRNAAVVMITGDSKPEGASGALNLDVDAYLVKGSEGPDEILAAVSKARRSREARRAGVPGEKPESRILIVANRPDAGARLAEPIDRRGGEVVVEIATALGADVFAGEPLGVLVVDGVGWSYDEVLRIVGDACARAPAVTPILVRSTAGLSVDELRRLIELGVKGLFDETVYRRTINDFIEDTSRQRRMESRRAP